MSASERSRSSTASELIWPFNGGQATWVEDTVHTHTSSKPAMPEILDFPVYSLDPRDWWLPRWRSNLSVHHTASKLTAASADSVHSQQIGCSSRWTRMSWADAQLLDAMHRLFPAVIIDVNYTTIVDQERILMSNEQQYKGIVPFYFKVDTFVEMMSRRLRTHKWRGKEPHITHGLVDALSRILLNAVGFVQGYGDRDRDECTLIASLTPRHSLQEDTGPFMTLKPVRYNVEFKLLGSLSPGQFICLVPKFSLGCRPFALPSLWKAHAALNPATRWLRWNKVEGCFFGKVPKTPKSDYSIEFKLEQVCGHRTLKVGFQKIIFMRIRLRIQPTESLGKQMPISQSELVFEKRMPPKPTITAQSQSNLSTNFSKLSLAAQHGSSGSSVRAEDQEIDDPIDSGLGSDPSESEGSGGLSAIIETTQDHRDQSLEWNLDVPKVRNLSEGDLVPVTSSDGELIFSLDESEDSGEIDPSSRQTSADVSYYQSDGSPIRKRNRRDESADILAPPSTPVKAQSDHCALLVCTPQGKHGDGNTSNANQEVETHVLPSPLSVLEDQIDARFKYRDPSNLADSPSGWALSDSDEQDVNDMF